VRALRVVFFSSYTGLGGGETSLVALFGALDRARTEPVLVCPRPGQLPEAAGRRGVEVAIARWTPARVFFVPALARRSAAARAVGAALQALEPDVVHSDFHTLPFAVPACRALHVPLVFTCYGWWFRPRPWQRALYRPEPSAVLAISEAVKEGFLGEPPFMDPNRVEVVPLGVDTGTCRPRPSERDGIRQALGLAADAPLVSLVARYQSVKGHDVFLDAALRILDARPEARFAIAGENVFGVRSDAAFKRSVTQRVATDSRLKRSVTLLGWVEKSELLLAASDVVVCSSRFESFGMVPVEAMACGVPVVSTNRGGPSETMAEGETGFLVPPGRPDLIAARVVALLADDELRRRMGQAGRSRVEERFTVTRYAARMTDVFESAASRRP
jgi:glycosyltransferase involved in cell wall biosynthesis